MNKVVIKMSKDMIKELNHIAQSDWNKAQAMLDGINMVLGTQYSWLAKRVVYYDNPNGGIAERDASVHDAWVMAED